MYPQNPSIQVTRTDLKDIKFPLAFKLCVSLQDEDIIKVYNKYGYSTPLDFFLGESMHNNSILGWGGHTKNNSVFGSVKG